MEVKQAPEPSSPIEEYIPRPPNTSYYENKFDFRKERELKNSSQLVLVNVDSLVLSIINQADVEVGEHDCIESLSNCLHLVLETLLKNHAEDFAVAITFHGHDLIRHIKWLTASTELDKSITQADISKRLIVISDQPQLFFPLENVGKSPIISPVKRSNSSRRNTPGRFTPKTPKSPFFAPNGGRTAADIQASVAKTPLLAQITRVLEVLWEDNITLTTYQMWDKREHDEIATLRLTIQDVMRSMNQLQHITTLTAEFRWPFAPPHPHHGYIHPHASMDEHSHVGISLPHSSSDLSQQRWQRFRSECPHLVFKFIAISSSSATTSLNTSKL